MADSAHMRSTMEKKFCTHEKLQGKENSSAHMESTWEKNGSLETMKKSKRAQMSLGQNCTKIKEGTGIDRHSGFPRLHF